MKKILAVLITLVLAGGAFAVVDVPDVQLAPLSGGAGEITVNVSDTFYIDILATAAANGNAALLINTGEVLITIDGNAEFIGNEDFTYWYWWGMGVGTNMFEYVDSKTLRMTTGYIGTSEMFMMPLPDPTNGNLAIDHIGIHCTGVDDPDNPTIITVSAANEAKPWGNVVIMNSAGQAEKDMEAIGGQLIVHQIPEPMTVLLLGLGGLFLRRRK